MHPTRRWSFSMWSRRGNMSVRRPTSRPANPISPPNPSLAAASCSARSRRPSADLQRHDLVAMELEDVIEVQRAAGEIGRDPRRNDCLAISLDDAERLDGVLVLPAGLDPPRLDCGDALDRPSLVAHDGIDGETTIHALSVASVLRCKIGVDRCGEMNGHRSFSWLRKTRALSGRSGCEARCG